MISSRFIRVSIEATADHARFSTAAITTVAKRLGSTSPCIPAYLVLLDTKRRTIARELIERGRYSIGAGAEADACAL